MIIVLFIIVGLVDVYLPFALSGNIERYALKLLLYQSKLDLKP